MSQFELYLIKSFSALMILYLFYYFLLKKETSFRWNRFFLLFTGMFSMTVPFISLSYPSEKIGKIVTLVLTPVNVSPLRSYSSGDINYPAVLAVLYSAIAAVLFTRFIYKVLRIISLAGKSKTVAINGYRIVLLKSKEHSPFSFFSTIFLPEENLNDQNVDKIIKHEAVHIAENHSFDMIIFELITIFQWFNPFAWLCKRELVAQHEFSADSRVMNSGTERKIYKDLIFSYSMQLSGSSVTNNFNSLLKRRFEMLTKTTSGKRGKVKVLFSIPVILLLVVIFGCKSESVNSTQAGNTPSPAGKAQMQGDAYTFVQEMPTYPAGQEKLLRFIGQNVVYPAIAKKAGVQGKVMIGFVVEKDGSMADINVLKGIGSGCDEEAVRVCKLMGKWNPGKQDGKPVRVRLVIPFQFKLQ